jgi:cytidylate kinase
VTISGQAGTGAHDIGRLTAQKLGIDYVDQEILVEAARTLGVPMSSVVPFDERTASLGELLSAMFRRFLERSAAAGAADPMVGGGLDAVLGRTYAEAASEEGAQDVSDEQYVRTLTALVRDLATHDNVVIIGRGSQVILKDRSGVLNVLLVAPQEFRVRSFAQREGVSEEEAARRVQESGRGRAAFHQKFFKVDVDKPALYHIAVNTGRLSQDAAADMIAQATRLVAAQQPV